MIDGFAPQPWPIECSADGDDWQLVIGWREDKPRDRLNPVVLTAKDGPKTLQADSVTYRTPGVTGQRSAAAMPRRRHAAPDPSS